MLDLPLKIYVNKCLTLDSLAYYYSFSFFCHQEEIWWHPRSWGNASYTRVM